MRTFLKGFLFSAIVIAPSVFGQCSAPYLVEQRFPVSGSEQTRWRICWQVHPKNGLIISAAYFRTSPNSHWIQVLWDARVSEIFVPYHDNSERYYDMSTVQDLADVGMDDCPAGTRLRSDPMLPTNVCEEVRDRLAWKEGPAVRRGQEVVLWASLIAGNYNYILEWTFRDDGIFSGRVGATAANLPANPMMAHMHDAIWRLDVDLDGPANDSVSLGVHKEVGDLGDDTPTPIPTARGLEWNQFQFNFLEVSDSNLKNGRAPGDHTSYMLMPLLSGTGRHTEGFTKYDLWVTAYDPAQMDARHLPTYAVGQSVANTDIVIWYKGNLHHIPRDEDGELVPGGWQGETQVMWTGFIMMPMNLFDRTPFYP